MRVLVVGGAGYIGSHTVYELKRAGHEVVVFDNLSTGNREAIPEDVVFFEGDLQVATDVKKVLATHKFDIVMHFAAKLIVPESVEQPIVYFENNVHGVAILLAEMLISGVNNVMFSSTAAVYGEPDTLDAMDENALLNPINPYGTSKRAAEDLIKAVEISNGMKHVIFRYFNVAGADASGEIGLSPKNAPTHLIPAINETALGLRPLFKIFGTDYPTADGTCIRDYIHITDLAIAHVLGAEYLIKTKKSQILNLGTNDGFSVQEIFDATEKVLGQKIALQLESRRAGDPAMLVASNNKAKEILGWNPTHSVEDMIISDYNWRKMPKFTNR
ncbi:UDP-glucose 4-epimerase [Erysipelotrichaceae bacterium]|nr:UDP-glucose 4-epimerase [Erysipelotrichaceae bacterium]